MSWASNTSRLIRLVSGQIVDSSHFLTPPLSQCSLDGKVAQIVSQVAFSTDQIPAELFSFAPKRRSCPAISAEQPRLYSMENLIY